MSRPDDQTVSGLGLVLGGGGDGIGRKQPDPAAALATGRDHFAHLLQSPEAEEPVVGFQDPAGLRVRNHLRPPVEGEHGDVTLVQPALPEALTDEGSIGRGDSGGPWMIDQVGEMRVVALGSWSYWEGAPEDFQAGAYGLTTYHTRVAAYRDWIEATIAGA